MTEIYLLEYLSVLWRRKIVFLSIFCFIFLVSFVLALKWSNYEAFATVEVAQPEIAMDVVESSGMSAVTMEAMADLQISRLKQKVFSTSSLAEIITKLDLYSGARKGTPIAYIAEEMRHSIDLELVGTALANPASAQKASALQLSAIAFVISFQYSDPLKAQQTVNELVSRFLEEDIKERKKMAHKTSIFLEGQIKILSESLEEQEKKIADFRASNGAIRPDSLAFNQQASYNTNSSLLSVESDIISNLGLVGALRAQLAQIDPYSRIIEDGETLTTPAIQLRALRSQYANLTAKYGPKHPDVVKVSRQIAVLESKVDNYSPVASIKARIIDVSAKLNTVRSKYGADHPEVISLTKQLDGLKDSLKSAEKDAESDSRVIDKDADNPAYLQVVAQLRAAEEQQRALEAQRDEIKRQQEEYSKAVDANPEVEKKFSALTRDYENLMVLYRELKARKLAADMSETIEQGHIGQRLAVINSPELPLETTPSKKLFLAAGFVLATISGFGAVFALQLLSKSVIGPHHLESLVGVAPLAVIPHLRSIDEKILIRRWLARGGLMIPILFAAFVLFFFLVVMPLDVFMAIVSRWFGG